MNPENTARPAAAGAALLAALLLAAAPAYATPAATPAEGAAEPVETVSPLRLEINVPAFRLDAFLGDERVATFPVTVGKRWEPTDPGRYQIESVVWNPWWHPPANRTKDKVTPPGPRNPMGRVKLHLRGLYYIHGTALDEQIGRAMSRGCVRLRNEDVLALARLVHEHAGPDLAPGELEALAKNPRRTRGLKLSRPVDVRIVYQVAEVRDGRLELHEDVYGLEARPLAEAAAAALAASGVPAERVDLAALAAALASAPEGEPAAGLPVAALLLPDDAAPLDAATLPRAGAEELRRVRAAAGSH